VSQIHLPLSRTRPRNRRPTELRGSVGYQPTVLQAEKAGSLLRG
jgi:hypothetical protein